MTLEKGRRLGPYEIIEQAGSGGMGEVFKATDTRLERTVALKILPETIAANADFRERFEREAKAISSLNHAHICTLYDVGHEDGLDYLVMEYLEGETLAARLERGPIAYDEMLQIAIQIASGLDSAHTQGMIHRDLKPGNVMLTKEGAKLLDFGLAKIQVDNGPSALSGVTRTTPLTGANTILGTMQYMAPEQLEGKELDVRADIFAFGAVVYEMATGKKAFEGSSNATLIAAVMERDPVSISAITPDTPPLFERLVRKCMAKDPDKRWQTVSDLLDELRWISQAGSQVGLPARIAARRKFKFDLARAIGLLTILTTVAFAYLYFSEKMKPAPELPVARFTVNVDQGLANVFWPRISPDGKSVAFHAEDSSGTNRIWVRPVNSLEAYPLLNTENANRFFWSPDGQNVAFFVGNQLKRIAISGGQAQLICQGANGSDGCWASSDLIIFDGAAQDTMKIVAAGGGLPRPASLIDTTSGESGFAWPWFLPDGKHFIFTCSVLKKDGNLRAADRIKLGSIDTTSSVTLYELGQTIDRVEYSNEGYILFVADDNLMALPFDADKLEVTGEPKPIAVRIGAAENTYAFSVSNNGALLYQTNNQSSQAELVWLDRAGKRLRTFGVPGSYGDVSISPDESRIAYARQDQDAQTTDLWVYDIERSVPTRLTFDPKVDGSPVWSPDGALIYFISNRVGDFFGVYRKNANGLGDAEPIYAVDTMHIGATSITADGAKLLVNYFDASFNVGIVALDEENRIEPLIKTPFFEALPAVSPNSRYVAYTSSESGQREIYVRKLDGSGGKWQISTEHASNAKWNGDGTELYYRTFDDQLMAVKVSTAENFQAGTPEELFQIRFNILSGFSIPYDVTDDGQHFLVCVRVSNSDPGQIVVVQNWAEEFKRE